MRREAAKKEVTIAALLEAEQWAVAVATRK